MIETLFATVLGAATQAAGPESVTLVPLRDGWAIAQAVALLVLAVAALVTFAALLRLALELRGLVDGANRLLKRIDDRVDPVLERARNVAENVDFISRAVRSDVEKLGDSVDGVRRRVDRAGDRMEERIDEFNALMDVAQAEAEEIFLDTASAVRGVRAGSRRLGSGPRRGRRDGAGRREEETTARSATDEGDDDHEAGAPIAGSGIEEPVPPPGDGPTSPRPTGSTADEE